MLLALSLSLHALTLTARSRSHFMLSLSLYALTLTPRSHSHCTLSLSVHALTHCTHRMLLTGGAIGYGALHLRPRRRHERSRRGERLLRVVRLWCLLDITLPPYFRRLDTCSLRVRDMSIYRLYTHTHARAHTHTLMQFVAVRKLGCAPRSVHWRRQCAALPAQSRRIDERPRQGRVVLSVVLFCTCII